MDYFNGDEQGIDMMRIHKVRAVMAQFEPVLLDHDGGLPDADIDSNGLLVVHDPIRSSKDRDRIIQARMSSTGSRGTKEIGKYDECYAAHFKTREPLTTIMRASGFSENEIANAIDCRRSRMRYLISTGYIAMRAHELQRTIERAVMHLALSVEYDADRMADTRLGTKVRKEHATLLKQTLDMLNPVIAVMMDREQNPHEHAQQAGYIAGEILDVGVTPTVDSAAATDPNDLSNLV